MSSLLQPTYWLTLQPPDVGGLLGSIVLGMFVVFLVLGITGRMVVDRRGEDRYKREIGNRISTLFVTMGILGVILFFFSFEQIQLFGARFWYPTWVIATVAWILFLVRYTKRDVPAKRAREERLREQGKYLPRQHRR
ncbi:MAG: hypothetical protein UY76_C0055G0007 [Candidatus Uhrbacteria bacterium GW2011_GWA2_52_8d]|uniref:Uncharacterized protein n=1 Tax=Candidatus Uhrbacteria bacterium GW2011_GWA2_52_8d TaxID=1618979 RepID=A0A0G2AGC9_9BACT|nr:MAG: hypothetical protein UY76_C0055G0007 [Candidatus Uhrbacteria bacterium GW2011_GWA2_52_8d]